METMTGGCQCGRIRYRVRVADPDAYLCHCRMCQRATGGVSHTGRDDYPRLIERWNNAGGAPDA